jgi:hypothetical protein
VPAVLRRSGNDEGPIPLPGSGLRLYALMQPPRLESQGTTPFAAVHARCGSVARRSVRVGAAMTECTSTTIDASHLRHLRKRTRQPMQTRKDPLSLSGEGGRWRGVKQRPRSGLRLLLILTGKQRVMRILLRRLTPAAVPPGCASPSLECVDRLDRRRCLAQGCRWG